MTAPQIQSTRSNMLTESFVFRRADALCQQVLNRKEPSTVKPVPVLTHAAERDPFATFSDSGA